MATGRPGPTGGDIAPVEDAQPAVSDEDKAKAEAEAEAAAPKNSGGKFVLYTGPRTAVANAEELKTRASRPGEGTDAIIYPANWAEVGITATRAHTWGLANSWRVPAGQFTDEQIDYLLATQKGRFELVDGAGNKVDR